MDVSCDKKTISIIEECICCSQNQYVLDSLRVNKVGHIIEIIVFLKVPDEMLIKEMTAKVGRIKDALKLEFTRPHEILVGFVPLKK